MKISNSKKQLAEIIYENGGWRDGEFAAQDSGGGVGGYEVKPEWDSRSKYWWRAACGEWFMANKIKNHHQTVLSRDEYFHLHPAPDADVGSLSAALALVTDENKHEHVDSKPTIEQLASDYRNAKEYADRKQQEADAAKADAEAKLAELVAAGKAIGLVLSVAESEVCDDWWVSYDGGGCPVDANEVVEVFLRNGRPSLDGPKAAHKWCWSIDGVGGDIIKWRKVKGDANA